MTDTQTIEQKPNLVSKITMAVIKANAKKFASPDGTPVALVFGRATGTKEVINKMNGDVYEALVGAFEAKNLSTGQVFQSAILYLPSGIHDAISSPVRQLEAKTDYVEFAFEMLAVEASNPSGFSYQARNLAPSRKVDPLDDMRKFLSLNGNSPSHQLSSGTPEQKLESVGGNSEEKLTSNSGHTKKNKNN